jgi:hypothetical protein
LLRNVKASSIDGKNLVLVADAGGTAITWTCDAATDIEEEIALKYFNCP